MTKFSVLLALLAGSSLAVQLNQADKLAGKQKDIYNLAEAEEGSTDISSSGETFDGVSLQNLADLKRKAEVEADIAVKKANESEKKERAEREKREKIQKEIDAKHRAEMEKQNEKRIEKESIEGMEYLENQA